MTQASLPIPSSQPWWKHGHIWMVIAGPALVVVASFITFYLAVSGSDTLVDEDYYRKGSALSQKQVEPGMMPAIQGRNHMATDPAQQPKR